MADWKSYIDLCEPGTMFVSMSKLFVVHVNGHPVLATVCANMAYKTAHRLDMARRSAVTSRHSAMGILVEGIGLCEEHAEDILEALLTGDAPKATHEGSESIN